MLTDMPRPRPLHLHRQVTRHGAVTWYVRIGKGPRVRIREDYGTPEFDAAYRAAIAGTPITVSPKQVSRGTIAWLIDRYRETAEWAAFSPATRKLREGFYARMVELSGGLPCRAITPLDIQDGLDSKKATPFQAAKWLDAMRCLFKWALKAKLVSIDPTAGQTAKTPATEGFAVWSEEEVERFERRWPVGTRERLAFDLLLYTGLRRGDVARLGRQHVRDGVISIRTAKTGQLVTLPVLPALAATIAATKVGDLAFIVTARGQPMVKEGFGNWFRDICREANVSGSAHGLRKLGATRAANAGATEAELEALFGWRGGGMASLYTREANRKKLAMGSAAKMATPTVYSPTSRPGGGIEAEKPAKTTARKQ